MNLRRIYLNLLVAFDALMKTRHVTRAAKLVGIGQPGMSAALSRLRGLFDDDLLVKQRGEMVPTARAQELQSDVTRILRDIDRLVSEKKEFDPRTSNRTFSLRLSDLLALLLLPALSNLFECQNLSTRLATTHLAPEATIDALERNTVELAISTELPAGQSIETQHLFDDEVVVIARSDHPSVEQLGLLDTFLEVKQVKVAQSPIDDRFADHQLAALGLDRSVMLTVPHWLAVPEIVSQTNLIAVVPRSIALRFARSHQIASQPLPLPDAKFAWALYWHRRHTHDPGLTWLREQIAECASDLVQAGEN